MSCIYTHKDNHAFVVQNEITHIDKRNRGIQNIIVKNNKEDRIRHWQQSESLK